MHADGSVVENGTVVIENGRITAVGGADLEIPFDVILKEMPEATIFPGFLEAHSNSGMDRANENVPIAPFLDVKDSIDPVSFYFEDSLRAGTVAIGILPGNQTIIGGRGRVVAPYGMTIEAMTIDDGLGMKMAIGPMRGWSRASQLLELRETIDKLDRSLRKLGQAKVDGETDQADRKKAGEPIVEDKEDGDAWDSRGGFVHYGEDFPGKELIAEEDLDDAQRGMVAILNGDERLWIWAPSASDIAHTQEWLTQTGLGANAVLVVTAECWKATDILAEMGLPVVLGGDLWHVERDPVSWKETRTFAPKKLSEAGIAFALSSVPGRMGPDRLAYQASMCIREGVPRAEAIAAVTTNPASFWGLSEEIGSFLPGAEGNFVVFDGDPLEAGSRVLEVWLHGDQAYDRSKDERLQRLEEGRLK